MLAKFIKSLLFSFASRPIIVGSLILSTLVSVPESSYAYFVTPTHQWIINKAIEYLRKKGQKYNDGYLLQAADWFNSNELSLLTGCDYADHGDCECHWVLGGNVVQTNQCDQLHHYLSVDYVRTCACISVPVFGPLCEISEVAAYPGGFAAPYYSNVLFDQALKFWPGGEVPSLSELPRRDAGQVIVVNPITGNWDVTDLGDTWVGGMPVCDYYVKYLNYGDWLPGACPKWPDWASIGNNNEDLYSRYKVPKESSDVAMRYLGWTIHLISDLTVPEHRDNEASDAHDVYEHDVDGYVELGAFDHLPVLSPEEDYKYVVCAGVFDPHKQFRFPVTPDFYPGLSVEEVASEAAQITFETEHGAHGLNLIPTDGACLHEDADGITGCNILFWDIAQLEVYLDTAIKGSAAVLEKYADKLLCKTPVLYTPVVSQYQIDLTWAIDWPSNEDGTEIWMRESDDTVWTLIGMVEQNERSYSVTDVLPRKTYCFKVFAFNSIGKSAASNEVCATTNQVPPYPPSNLTATAVTCTRNDLTWEDNSDNENGFRVYALVDVAGGWPVWGVIATVGPNTKTYSVSPNATPYCCFYIVTAFNSIGESTASNEVDFVPIDGLSAPTNLTATATASNRIDLNWQDNSGDEKGFQIWWVRPYNYAALINTQIDTVDSDVTAYPVTGLNPGEKYCYRVTAFRPDCISDYSDVACATTYQTIPRAPTNLVAEGVSGTEILLTWMDNSGNEEGFGIQQALSSSGPFSTIGTVERNVRSYLVSGLTPSETYFYRIYAYNSAGESEPSDKVYANTSGGMDAPTNLIAEGVSESEILLTWMDRSTEEDGFEIEEKGLDGDIPTWTKVATVGAGVTSCPIMVSSGCYASCYRVLAFKSVGHSGPSNEACIVTPPCTAIRHLPDVYIPQITIPVVIEVTPTVMTWQYSVVDNPPQGWTVSNIDNGGIWDELYLRVKWTFLDNASRTLRYEATPPIDAAGMQTFSGKVIFNEYMNPISFTSPGDSEIRSKIGSECATWEQVIERYNSYVNGEVTWSDVIGCYNQYTNTNAL